MSNLATVYLVYCNEGVVVRSQKRQRGVAGEGEGGVLIAGGGGRGCSAPPGVATRITRFS